VTQLLVIRPSAYYYQSGLIVRVLVADLFTKKQPNMRLFEAGAGSTEAHKITNKDKKQSGRGNAKRFFSNNRGPRGAAAPPTRTWKLIHDYPHRNLAWRKT